MWNALRIFWVSLGLLIGALWLAGCSSAEQGTRYSMTGQVISLEARSQEAIIRHEPISGYMEAMTMGYHVKSKNDFAKLAAGQVIRADLVVTKDHAWLENVRVEKEEKPEPPAISEYHYPQPGEKVPAFTVIDQDGHRFRLDQHYPALVTFVYTRCPLPDYCPRMNGNFQAVAAKLRDTAHKDLNLVTISFDPEYDTPAVLKKYRKQWADTPQLKEHWTFAVPAKSDMPALLKYFAVNAYADQGLIAHSLSTTLISQDGKILAWWHGNDWTADDVAAKLR